MKLSKYAVLSFLALTTLASQTLGVSISTIEEFDQQLPVWGTSWTPGTYNVNGYHPSFYTGFAPRVQTPDRIHIHMARGNQTRVSVILDENTVSNYLFDLVARANFYSKMIKSGLVNVNPAGAKFTPQESYYQQIVDSPVYGIRKFIEQDAPLRSAEAIYERSLAIMKALNNDRMFAIRLDLRNEFLKWKNEYLPQVGVWATTSSEYAAFAINTLVLGRTNLASKPTDAQITKLKEVIKLSRSGTEDEFIFAARDLFKMVTGAKYKFKVLNSLNKWEEPVQCEIANHCFLVYPEFTAIYPTGSLKKLESDKHGNKIPALNLPGLWQFTANPNADIDNIRPEPYYGWIPKMDYQNQSLGLGFHNPAVRFFNVEPAAKKSLSIPANHNSFWSVKRGGVSHGCSRLAAGHNWELRHIMPVENAKMAQVRLYANSTYDFDLYDINGDGQLEVMGVEYLISYDLQGTSGLMSREGLNLQVNQQKKNDFYTTLYGAKNVFTFTGNGLMFETPDIPVHTFDDFEKYRVRFKLETKQKFPLYEQPYERDKLQFFTPPTLEGMTHGLQTPISKRIVRILGRVQGCAPHVSADACGQSAFESEASAIFSEAKKVW